MLNPLYRYIAFDFETTGLDTKKDEPIQIGIVEFDDQFNIIDTYQSLIKPQKDITELKDIVRFITGFKLEDLEDAPIMQDVVPEIKKFFDENTVVVGHNIGFDVAILQNYLEWTPAHQVDTYPLSRALFHFKASYALDILDKELHKGQGMSSSDNYHDALTDSHASIRLFKSCMDRITNLRHKYLLLDYVIQESTGLLQHIIKRTPKPFKFEQKQLFFPSLKKEHTNNKKVILKHPYKLGLSKECYIGNVALHDLITNTDWTQTPRILAFTHKSKLQLAQKYFSEIGVTTGSLHDGVVFDAQLVNLFLQKKHFSDEEVLFVSKYYSHYHLGHAVMDINAAGDYKIFGALTTRKSLTAHNIRLCTHLQLFQLASNIEEKDHILFFDKERRYQNYSKWMKQAFDPIHRINLIENTQYKYHITGEKAKEKLYGDYLQQCTVFIGILSTEIDKLYINYNQPKLEIDGILDNARFPKTKQLFEQLNISTQHILAHSDNHIQKVLQQQWQKLSTYLLDPCEVEKRMYNGDQWYYLLHQQAVYLGYEDFLQQLPAATYQFLSNSNKQLPACIPSPGEKEIQGISMSTTSNPEQLQTKLNNTTGHQFVISSSKQASQELFKKLIARGLNKQFTIVAENITGGIGKNLYNARTSTLPIICIGGYNFYLASLNEKFDFVHIHLYHIQGAMKQQIVHDLWWYST